MSEEYKVKQIQPNHAEHISNFKENKLEELFANEIIVKQPKYDGERMLIHFDGDNVYCTSRRFSKKTNRYMENQDKLPKLKNIFPKNIGYTVLDCECYANSWNDVVSILHSLPERAIKLQDEINVKFAVFDCLYYNGQDIRNEKYLFRYNLAKDIVSMINRDFIHIVDNVVVNSLEKCKELMNKEIENGFEGIVVKSLNRAYYDKMAIIKCKKFETIDCVITGYKQGTGKYSNSIGALEIGYYDIDSNKFISISHVNCGSDEMREEINNNRDKYLYKVVEVKCQEITEKSLRHPVFIRLREDKDYKMCTKETIFKS